MKKIIAVFLCAVTLLLSFSGCADNSPKTGKLKIITTIFPLYDWVREITDKCGDVELSLLVDNGVDIHSFQPSAEDIINISTCDMFIYVGGESDGWVEDALKEKVNKDMVTVNLMDLLKNDIKKEEAVEGMQGAEDESGYDEHIWLSVKNAEKACESICDELVKLDSKNKKTYENSSKAYLEKLNALDNKFIDTVKKSEKKVMVFGDRFPLRYFADDYNIKYYAAFAGCSAETEASFKTITFLARKVDEYKLNSILKIETSDGKIAETIRNNTKNKNQKILTFNSMQNLGEKDVKNKVTYLNIMDKNSDVIEKCLN